MKIFKILLIFVVLQSSNIYAYKISHNKGLASNESLENNTSVLLGCSDSQSPYLFNKMLQPRQHNAVELTPANTQEIWKGVIGFEGNYEISNLGRLKGLAIPKNLKNNYTYIKPELILKLYKINSGYFCAKLHKDGNSKTHLIHRIVATAFISNPENKTDVNHKNGIKDDNRAENLEWCTHSENLIHAHKIGLKKPTVGEKASGSKLTDEQVLHIRNSKLPRKQLQIMYNIQLNTISNIINRKTWKHI